ncbi:hypothetical protein Acr_00g0028420 [Actinidia rufa]|uniref:Uncharacterized protein n=1 Tax=Actinidia rufa TaxID=165716 RepID=A0A7J0DFL8_9ERIC|nr:hypothetical protein Acr_00g0028420 [Actinidia rufa]
MIGSQVTGSTVGHPSQAPHRQPPPLASNPPPLAPNPPPPWTTPPLSHSSSSPESTTIGTESTTIGTNPPPSAPNPPSPSPAPNPPPPWTTPPLSHSSSSSELLVPVHQKTLWFDGFEVEPQVVTVQADFRCSLVPFPVRWGFDRLFGGVLARCSARPRPEEWRRWWIRAVTVFASRSGSEKRAAEVGHSRTFLDVRTEEGQFSAVFILYSILEFGYWFRIVYI